MFLSHLRENTLQTFSFSELFLPSASLKADPFEKAGLEV
jgi:hypothetical protein